MRDVLLPTGGQRSHRVYLQWRERTLKPIATNRHDLPGPNPPATSSDEQSFGRSIVEPPLAVPPSRTSLTLPPPSIIIAGGRRQGVVASVEHEQVALLEVQRRHCRAVAQEDLLVAVKCRS